MGAMVSARLDEMRESAGGADREALVTKISISHDGASVGLGALKKKSSRY
jgi:hypothetical protein